MSNTNPTKNWGWTRAHVKRKQFRPLIIHLPVVNPGTHEKKAVPASNNTPASGEPRHTWKEISSASNNTPAGVEPRHTCFCFFVLILTNILQFYPSFFSPHIDKHLAVLSQCTFDTQVNTHIWTSLLFIYCPEWSILYQVLHIWKPMFCFVLS